MTLVNTETGEVTEPLTAEQARELTDRIKVGVEAVWHLIVQAYQSGAHRALGYSSWDDYCTREFGTSRIRLPREERQEVVASLRESGLSIRAIGAATGMSTKTVQEEIRNAGVVSDHTSPKPLDRTDVIPNFKGGTPKEAKPVTGIDGKTYPGKSAMDRLKDTAKKHPVKPTVEQRVIDIRQLAERGNNCTQIAAALGVGREYVFRLANENGITLPDHITGKSRKIDSNRMVRETVTAVEGAAFGLNLIELDQLDPAEIEGWVISLSDSLKSLNSFNRKLKEKTQ